MSGSLANAANCEPNLTPILDMVFQLITFFMLVINFKAAALDLDLKLPVVGSAMPVDNKGQEDLLILNINQEGKVKLYGQIMDDIKGYIDREAQSSRLSAKAQRGLDIKVGEELPSTVVVRADKGTPFKLLNTVIVTCQTAGYRKFALKAMNKQEGK